MKYLVFPEVNLEVELLQLLLLHGHFMKRGLRAVHMERHWGKSASQAVLLRKGERPAAWRPLLKASGISV